MVEGLIQHVLLFVIKSSNGRRLDTTFIKLAQIYYISRCNLFSYYHDFHIINTTICTCNGEVEGYMYNKLSKTL
jgi:hypothetical protein